MTEKKKEVKPAVGLAGGAVFPTRGQVLRKAIYDVGCNWCNNWMGDIIEIRYRAGLIILKAQDRERFLEQVMKKAREHGETLTNKEKRIFRRCIGIIITKGAHDIDDIEVVCYIKEGELKEDWNEIVKKVEERYEALKMKRGDEK